MHKYYKPLAAGEEPPVPQGARRFLLFRPHGAKNLSASIKMPDGYTEILPTRVSEGAAATSIGSKRIHALYRERKIETPAQIRKKTGELSPYIRRKLDKGLPTNSATAAVGKEAPALESGPAPITENSDTWGASLARMENKQAQAFTRIQILCLMGFASDDADPISFRDQVRSIIVETTLQGVTPMGRIQRKRVPSEETAPAKRRRGRPPGS